jgi:hypothetical protein
MYDTLSNFRCRFRFTFKCSVHKNPWYISHPNPSYPNTLTTKRTYLARKCTNVHSKGMVESLDRPYYYFKYTWLN